MIACPQLTLCRFIIESADRLGLQYFVPCHGSVHCVTLELPSFHSSEEELRLLRNVSVVAGHFFWEVWKGLPAFLPTVIAPLLTGESQPQISADRVPSCLVMGRHPVERAISYYYQRCYQLPNCIGFQRRINELSAAELEFVTLRERQADYAADNATLLMLDEGMADAACRSMAGLKATTGLVVDLAVPVPLPEELNERDTERAIRNVRHCVVGVLEHWEDTQEVLAAWFPWLDFSTDTHRRKMHIYSGKETVEEIRPELREVLLSLNTCDWALYQEMLRLFAAQLAALRESEAAFK